MNKMTKMKQGGFTLIEILIVIGIIAILAAIVLVAVNPAKNFREAANTQRSANVNAILSAINQYTIDHKGDMDGLSLPSTADPIGGASGDTDLCVLVPDFIGAIPVDPDTKQTDSGLDDDDQSISADDCDEDYKTGYEVKMVDNHVTVSAPNTVDKDTGVVVDSDKIISVTR